MAFADVAVMETVQQVVDTIGAEMRSERSDTNITLPPIKVKKVRSNEGSKQLAKTDPLRVLDPGRKKLTTVESQRVLAVLDESIKRIEVATLLPYVSQNVDRFSAVLGHELTTSIKDHNKIKDSYTEICNRLREIRNPVGDNCLSDTGSSQRSTPISRGASAGSLSRSSSRNSSAVAGRIKQDEEDMKSALLEEEEHLTKILSGLTQQMSFSIRNILRLLSLNPASVNGLRSERKKRDQEASNFITYINELRGFLLERLLTTPLEEKDKTDYLLHITIRERNNLQVIKKLSTELKAAEDEKDAEISKRNKEIGRLKAELNQIEKFSDEHIRRTQSEAEKQHQADAKNSEGKQAKLQAELQSLKNQLAANTAEHRERELALRKRKYKIETEVENWIQKYDTDMGERQDEYEDLDGVYTEEKAQLNELEERFATLETEYTTIVEEKKIAKEKKEREEKELALMIAGATFIQAFWRSYKCRKALRAKKKKGKKGKKGKGKGKKK